jgi:ferric-dicitrate binding protein FerR (iron transport regulator)
MTMHEGDIERVLKAAGRRERAPAEVEKAVREHLRAEWQAIVAERRGRRRAAAGIALAASVLIAVLGLWYATERPGTAAPIATMAVAHDDVQVRAGWLRGWEHAPAGRDLSAGATLRTGANGRAALVLPGIASARLDHGTRIRIATADRLVIESGGLYVDAGAQAPSNSPLVIETPAGVVRHVGTQYEVRVEGTDVRLRVREGRIEWRSNAGTVESGRAGEQLTIAANGAVTRASAARFGETWDWIASTTPAVDIEGRPLSEFLAWAGRELGREVVFATPEVAAEASSIVVHGSIDGLTPAQALVAVLETTSVRGTFTDERIVVRREGTGDEYGAH